MNHNPMLHIFQVFGKEWKEDVLLKLKAFDVEVLHHKDLNENNSYNFILHFL